MTGGNSARQEKHNHLVQQMWERTCVCCRTSCIPDLSSCSAPSQQSVLTPTSWLSTRCRRRCQGTCGIAGMSAAGKKQQHTATKAVAAGNSSSNSPSQQGAHVTELEGRCMQFVCCEKQLKMVQGSMRVRFSRPAVAAAALTLMPRKNAPKNSPGAWGIEAGPL